MLAAQARTADHPVSAGWWELNVEPRMFTCVAEANAVEDAVTAAQDNLERTGPNLERTGPLELSHQISPTGETVVELAGELDIASAEAAVSYITDILDRHGGPVIVDLNALAFCDARGLAALVRMAGYAEQRGCPFRLASPSPSLVKIMRITGLDRGFFPSQAPPPHR